MKAAQRAAARAALIILHEVGVESGGSEFLGVPGLQKEAALIAVHRRLDEQDFGKVGRTDPQTGISSQGGCRGMSAESAPNQPQSFAAAGSL